MYKLLTNKKRFSESQAAQYMVQMTRALQYLHENKVIHRDIKPENLLVSISGELKIADFGCRQTMCGTMDYLPPEMVEGKDYDENIDIWSLGVLCYEFLVGKPPFESNDSNQTYHKIRHVNFDYPPHVSPLARDLIDKLLVKDPKQRMTLADVFRHPWIVEFSRRKPLGSAQRAGGQPRGSSASSGVYSGSSDRSMHS